MGANRSSRVLAAGAALCLVAAPAPLYATDATNIIEAVQVRESRGVTTILLRGSATAMFSAYRLDEPQRVVVDLASADLHSDLLAPGEESISWRANTWAVGEIAAHRRRRASTRIVRVVVRLARDSAFRVRSVGSHLFIAITPGEPPPSAPDAAALLEAQKAAQGARRDAQAAQEKQAAAEAELTAHRQAAARSHRAVAEARESMTAAQKAAARAEAEAARQAAWAKKVVAEANAAAAQERTAAEAERKAASTRLAQAKVALAEAAGALAEARRIREEAEEAARAAKAGEARAAERELAAQDAEERAVARRQEADAASRASLRARRAAQEAVADTERAAALRRAAETAAEQAVARRAEAETAAQNAQRQRREAEAAARAAETRRRAAEEAAQAADRQREIAKEQRAAAERAGAAAERDRARAQERKRQVEAEAAEASRRADKARQLRAAEERAVREAALARQRAEEQRRATAQSREDLARAQQRLRHAEAAVRDRHAELKAAEARSRELRQERAATRREIEEARAAVERVRGLLDKAEKGLAQRRRELAAQRRAVQETERQRVQAAKGLAALRDQAERARALRRSEERRLAELAAARTREEEKLDSARKERDRAERAAAAAQATAAASRAEATRTNQPQISAVEFVAGSKTSRVVIELNGSAPATLQKEGATRRVLEITGAEIPSELERTLDASRYRGPLRSIASYRHPREDGAVRIAVELNYPTASRLVREENQLIWEFANQRRDAPQAPPASAAAHGDEQGGDAAARAVLVPVPLMSSSGFTSSAITQQTVRQFAAQQRRVYRGVRIDLDFKDADIHNLLRLLADIGGINIVIPDDIQFRVTVRMRRVPWDQALEVILASKGLWYRRVGNLYRIAPRKELDAEDQAEAERRRARAIQEAPRPEVFTLNYVVVEDIKNQLLPLLSPRGNLQVDKRTNTLIINDLEANRNQIIALVRRLDVAEPQVQIEARIVEARSTFIREVGIQWGGNSIASAATGNATGLIFPNSVAIRGGAEDAATQRSGVSATPSDFAVNLPAAVGSGSGGAVGISLGSVGGNFNINLRLSALEDTGTVRIISAPKITVVNNIKAEISQGVSIPISVISANGVQTQFVPADLKLAVTPHVSGRDCSVMMEIEVKKNEADFVNTGARGDPTILRKEAKTTISLPDGGTTVIGGIYTRNSGISYSKVPLLGDLPIIGWLFKSRRENDDRTEVLVFITPKITNRASLRCE